MPICKLFSPKFYNHGHSADASFWPPNWTKNGWSLKVWWNSFYKKPVYCFISFCDLRLSWEASLLSKSLCYCACEKFCSPCSLKVEITPFIFLFCNALAQKFVKGKNFSFGQISTGVYQLCGASFCTVQVIRRGRILLFKTRYHVLDRKNRLVYCARVSTKKEKRNIITT